MNGIYSILPLFETPQEYVVNGPYSFTSWAAMLGMSDISRCSSRPNQEDHCLARHAATWDAAVCMPVRVYVACDTCLLKNVNIDHKMEEREEGKNGKLASIKSLFCQMWQVPLSHEYKRRVRGLLSRHDLSIMRYQTLLPVRLYRSFGKSTGH